MQSPVNSRLASARVARDLHERSPIETRAGRSPRESGAAVVQLDGVPRRTIACSESTIAEPAWVFSVQECSCHVAKKGRDGSILFACKQGCCYVFLYLTSTQE